MSTEYLKEYWTWRWVEKRPRDRPWTQWLDQVKGVIERKRQSWGKVDETQKWRNRDSFAKVNPQDWKQHKEEDEEEEEEDEGEEVVS
jgi:hypothetical protein